MRGTEKLKVNPPNGEGNVEITVCFELTPGEIVQLRELNWRNGRGDLQAQTIVRDYLLRQRLKAERIQRDKKRLAESHARAR